MRKFYKSQRDRLLCAIENCPHAHRLTVLEEDAGLHFLVQVDTTLSDEALVEFCRKSGILVQSLRSFYHGDVPDGIAGKLVVNYSGLTEARLAMLEQKLRSLD
jgi:GntR family transcriptional regulator/MocR family aminotransferase